MPLATATRDHDLFGPQAHYGKRICLFCGASFISGMVYLLGCISRPIFFFSGPQPNRQPEVPSDAQGGKSFAPQGGNGQDLQGE